jgi:hypothetical protein
MRRGLHFTILRQKLIIKRLKVRRLDYEDLRDYLLESNLFEEYNERSYSVKTLQRDIQDVELLYGVVIKNERFIKGGSRSDNRYFVDEIPEDIKNWLLK